MLKTSLTIRTDFSPLVDRLASCICAGDHEHAEVRGTDVVASAFYTPRFAQEVGAALCHTLGDEFTGYNNIPETALEFNLDCHKTAAVIPRTVAGSSALTAELPCMPVLTDPYMEVETDKADASEGEPPCTPSKS